MLEAIASSTNNLFFMKLRFKFLAVLTLLSVCCFAQINCLKFASTAAYETALADFYKFGFNNIEGYSTYTSLKSTFTEPVVPDGYDEDAYDTTNDQTIDETRDYKAFGILPEILNADKVVIIGNWIVKVDLTNQRGLILNTTFSNQYNDILTDNLNNINIKVVGLDVEGLEYIDNLDNPQSSNGTQARRCTGARQRSADNFFYSTDRRKRLDAKVVYQRALVYFSLQAKGKCQKRRLGIWWADDSGFASMANIETKYSKCFGAGFGYAGVPCPGPGPYTGTAACLLGYEEGRITSFRAYYGGRGLPNYFYGVTFTGSHGAGYLEIREN